MDWEEIHNNGKARGYWATPSEIQNRIKEREKNKRKDSLIILGIVIGGIGLLITTTLLLI